MAAIIRSSFRLYRTAEFFTGRAFREKVASRTPICPRHGSTEAWTRENANCRHVADPCLWSLGLIHFWIGPMGSDSFTIPRARLMPDVLKTLPKAFRDQAEKGFVVLAGVPAGHYAEILQAVFNTLDTNKPPLEDLEKELRLPMSSIRTLFAASMLSVTTLGDRGSAQTLLRRLPRLGYSRGS